MSSVKLVSENLKLLPDNVKEEVRLYGDPRLDENKIKFILEVTSSHIKSTNGYLRFYKFSGSIFD